MLGISNELDKNHNLLYIIVGSVLIIVSLIIVLIKKFNQSNRNIVINAVLVYDQMKEEFLKIQDYTFSYDVIECLTGACVEDKNIQELWEKEQIEIDEYYHCPDEDNIVDVSRNGTVISQLLEYIVLERLSLITTDYFHLLNYNKNKVKSVQRDEIQDFVNSNVFVDLLSKPLNERKCFENDEDIVSSISLGDDIKYGMGKNGEIYNQFELYIPSKCKISKKEDSIILKHPYFRLTITPSFDGSSIDLPYYFLKKYVKADDWFNTSCYGVSFSIHLKFSYLAFFMNKSQYYKWIDEFANDLCEYASIDDFLKKIHWNFIEAIFNCM